MRIQSEHKIGVFPGRLSFGFVGRLDSVGITSGVIVVQVRDVFLTDDSYDRSKLALAGIKDHLEILTEIPKEGTWDSHIAAVTKQGSCRTLWCAVKYECQPSLDLDCRWRGFANPLDCGLCQGQVVFTKLMLFLPITNFTQGFFILGDKQWDEIVHSVKNSAEKWKERTSILKRTLCP